MKAILNNLWRTIVVLWWNIVKLLADIFGGTSVVLETIYELLDNARTKAMDKMSGKNATNEKNVAAE